MNTVQRMLADFMSELSEEVYLADWLNRMEYVLWTEVLNYRQHCPDSIVCDRAKSCPFWKLITLSDACGGWIVWDDHEGPVWMPMAEWVMRYEEYQYGKTEGVI